GTPSIDALLRAPPSLALGQTDASTSAAARALVRHAAMGHTSHDGPALTGMEHQPPLVSILVPIVHDDEESRARLQNAHAQTWRAIEVIPVYACKEPKTESRAADSHCIVGAVEAGVAASRGDYVSLLLPGVLYEPHKI